MTYRTAADCQLRAYIWGGMMVCFVLAMIAFLAFIATPAARAVIEAATHRPAICAQYAPSDCGAAASEGW